MSRINLGAGTDQLKGFVNVDFLDLPGIDVVHNLMEFPYPFDTGSAEEIRAIDVIEHLDNFYYTPEIKTYLDKDGKVRDQKLAMNPKPTIIAFIEECHRILKPNGLLYIQAPGYNAEFLWQDPSHVRGFHVKTFDLFDPSTEFGKTTGFYSSCKFEVRSEELKNHNLRFYMVKI